MALGAMAFKKVGGPATANEVGGVDDIVGAASKSISELTLKQSSAIRKIENTIKNHLKPGSKGDISGTVSDMVGNPIPKPSGGHWDHVQEMSNTLRGLRKHVKTLEGVADPAAKAARQQALDVIKQVESAIQGSGI